MHPRVANTSITNDHKKRTSTNITDHSEPTIYMSVDSISESENISSRTSSLANLAPLTLGVAAPKPSSGEGLHGLELLRHIFLRNFRSRVHSSVFCTEIEVLRHSLSLHELSLITSYDCKRVSWL